MLCCGECPLWGDIYETAWGTRIGKCPFQTCDTMEKFTCDVPVEKLEDYAKRVQEVIEKLKKWEAKVHA